MLKKLLFNKRADQMTLWKSDYGDFEVRPDLNKKCLTITELCNFLSELVKAGFGDYTISASTQDGGSYDITGSLLAHTNIKNLEFN